MFPEQRGLVIILNGRGTRHPAFDSKFTGIAYDGRIHRIRNRRGRELLSRELVGLEINRAENSVSSSGRAGFMREKGDRLEPARPDGRNTERQRQPPCCGDRDPGAGKVPGAGTNPDSGKVGP